MGSKSSLTVRDLPVSERPRERLYALGPEALSAQEILACLLGRGCSGESVLITAQRLLSRFGGIRGIAQASLEELALVPGIGRAKAAQIQAAVELSRRVEADGDAPAGAAGFGAGAAGPSAELRAGFGAGASVGRLVEDAQAAGRVARRHLRRKKKEYFILLLLDSRHRILRVAEISVGTLDMSVVHPRETFREAIRSCAAAVIVAHNHPSGDPTPSREDLDLTRRLVGAGRLLGIPVLDHLIVGAAQCLSLRQNGFLDVAEAEGSPSAGAGWPRPSPRVRAGGQQESSGVVPTMPDRSRMSGQAAGGAG